MAVLQKKIDCAVIGDWHLAFTTASSLASLGHRVLLVNPSEKPEQHWLKFPEVPLREPGMSEVIEKCLRLGNLDFANGVTDRWTADRVWLAIDTPVNERDEADTTSLERVAQQVSQNQPATGTFVISSQIPMGFSDQIENTYGLTVAYVPENLRLGKGLETFLKADRTVIGSKKPEIGENLKKFLSGLETEFFLCDLVTSEMIKHATNVFLATSISFANELARIGELMGVDNQAVGRALKLDKRIGKAAYVTPGLGFAGGTLPRDLRILQKIGANHHFSTPLIDAVLEVNETAAKALISTLKTYFLGHTPKQVLIVGYTYKAETDTLRRSSSLEMAEQLTSQGVEVLGYDPVMNGRDLSSLKGKIVHYNDWEKIPCLPDAVVVMTPRPQFAELDWKALGRQPRRSKINTPPLILDTGSIMKTPDHAREAGFAYKALWQPVLLPISSEFRPQA